eukprot:6027976-Prymnesium_polylepis.1
MERPLSLGVLQPSLLRQMAPAHTAVRERVQIAAWVEHSGNAAADDRGAKRAGGLMPSLKPGRRQSVSASRCRSRCSGALPWS